MAINGRGDDRCRRRRGCRPCPTSFPEPEARSGPDEVFLTPMVVTILAPPAWSRVGELDRRITTNVRSIFVGRGAAAQELRKSHRGKRTRGLQPGQDRWIISSKDLGKDYILKFLHSILGSEAVDRTLRDATCPPRPEPRWPRHRPETQRSAASGRLGLRRHRPTELGYIVIVRNRS